MNKEIDGLEDLFRDYIPRSVNASPPSAKVPIDPAVVSALSQNSELCNRIEYLLCLAIDKITKMRDLEV